jgi:DNA-directed RNA polymerase specialized sigma24 family protein
MWPPDADLVAVWSRLSDDPTAPGRFAAIVLPALEADLARQFPRVDPEILTDAADTAVATVLRNPAVYNPDKATLAAFLRLVARRDLLNLIRAERRHQRRRIPWESVELSCPDGNEEEDTAVLADYPAIQAVIDALCETDRRVLELMLDGERQTLAFAEVLGLADRSATEVADAVKRVKDRIKARLKRAGGKG